MHCFMQGDSFNFYPEGCLTFCFPRAPVSGWATRHWGGGFESILHQDSPFQTKVTCWSQFSRRPRKEGKCTDLETFEWTTNGMRLKTTEQRTQVYLPTFSLHLWRLSENIFKKLFSLSRISFWSKHRLFWWHTTVLLIPGSTEPEEMLASFNHYDSSAMKSFGGICRGIVRNTFYLTSHVLYLLCARYHCVSQTGIWRKQNSLIWKWVGWIWWCLQNLPALMFWGWMNHSLI